MTELGISGGPEIRSAEPQGYTDQLVREIQRTAIGRPDLSALGAVETAASLWARSLAAATVEPMAARSALSPDLLAMTGGALVLRGEFAAVLAVERGRIALRPCRVYDVQGDSPDWRDWRYSVTIPSPGELTLTRTLPAADVLHVRYGAREDSPWRGRSPLESAATDARALAGLLFRIGQEAGSESGTVYMLGEHLTHLQDQQANHPLGELRGRTRMTYGAGDTEPRRLRIGFQPPQGSLEWADGLQARFWAACGFSPALFASGGDGTSQREAFRRFTASTVEHLGELVALEAERKLELPVALSFERLRGSDVQGLGRAVKSLVESGQSLADALAAVGLE